jgi:hypothetical protein
MSSKWIRGGRRGKTPAQAEDANAIVLSGTSNHAGVAVTSVGIVLIFGIIMAGRAGTSLLVPGTSPGRIWQLNPNARLQLVPIASIVGPGFLLLAAALTIAAVGWFRHRFWGWVLTVVILGVQFLGDVVNLARGDYLRGGAGIVIAGLFLVYLFRPAVRSVFSAPRAGPHQ